MKRLIFLLAVFLTVGFSACDGGSLKGRYVAVWDFHKTGDAESVYEFNSDGSVIQDLKIAPDESLGFKGVEDTRFGRYEISGDTVKIIIGEENYEMKILEKTGEHIVFGIYQTDGTMIERTFLKN